MRRDPRVTLLCYDPRQPLRYLEVRGAVVEMTEEGAMAHLDALTSKYLGKPASQVSPGSREDSAAGWQGGSGDKVRQQGRPATVIPVAPRFAAGTEPFPAAVLDLHPGRRVAAGDEADLDLGCIATIAVEVPRVAEARRRFPDGDLAPVVLDPTRQALEDPTPGRPSSTTVRSSSVDTVWSLGHHWAILAVQTSNA